MKVVNESFNIKCATYEEIPTAKIPLIHKITKYFDLQSALCRCQEKLVAYEVSKLIERYEHMFTTKTAA